MFNHCFLPFLLASFLILKWLCHVPDPPDIDNSSTPLLVRDKPNLSLSSQFMTVLKVYRNKAQGPVCRNKQVLLYLCSLLLAQSYAPEPNPGPRTIKFPCGLCSKACKWTTPSVCCDSCDVWYHQECMGMPETIFKALTNISWECIQCGLPNFSTGIFDTTILETSNTFSQLADVTGTDSEISFSCPNATSSPHRRQSSTTGEGLTSKRNDMPLRTLVVNCQSIKGAGKKAQLQNMLDATQADIVIGTESWLDSSIKSQEIFPSNFKAYRKDRSASTHGGGVFILVSENLSSDEPEELKEDEDCEIVWSKVKVKGAHDLYICAFYKPPNKTDPHYLEKLSTYLARIPRNAHLWLGGDFNLADINWNDECPLPQATHSQQCHQLLNITKDFFLDQVVTSPTRITEFSCNILDLFFTNNQTLINKCEVIPGIGDHEAVFVESSLRPMKVKKPPRKVYLYKRADYKAIENDLIEQYDTFLTDTEDMDANDTWQTFENKLKELIEKFIPSKMISGNKLNKPWINKEVKSHIRKRNKLFDRQKKSGKHKDRRAYQQAKQDTQRIERQAYWRYIEDLIEVGDTESDQQQTKQKRFWNYIKSLRKDNCGVSPLKDQGRLYSDSTDKANILNKQYQSVFTQEDTSDIPTPMGNPAPTMPNIAVTTEGIAKLLKKLNPQKASGPDMIPARVLKELADQCAPYLKVVFDKCLSMGSIPDVWRTAMVSAIFKKGDRFKASNYRPVSLTCISCKMLEHIVVSNIMRHLDNNNILSDSQHGFRRRRSCETQLLTLVDELAKSMDKGKQHDLAVLDFSKAFDRVPHQRLLKKLHHCGIRGDTLNWIQAFLTNRTQRVVVDGSVSKPAPVVSGVPQGSVLGPVLFLIFINDVPMHINCKSRLFADDLVVYKEINTPSDCQILQDDLRALQKWEKCWGMAFHPEKCSILRVHRKRRPILQDYSLKNHILTSETTTRYLGVELAQNLSWNTNIDKTCKKANSTLGFIKRNLRINNEEVKSSAYFSLVRPGLEYCSSVWNPHTQSHKRKLEMVQRRAARFATGRYSNRSSVTDMLESLGWESLESRRQKSQLTMLYKIANDLVDIPADKYLTPAHGRTRAAHGKKFTQPTASTSYYSNSFFPRTIPVWNTLPATVAEAPDLVSFKQGLSSLTF